MKDFLPRSRRLAPLRLRAGELTSTARGSCTCTARTPHGKDRLVKASVYVGTPRTRLHAQQRARRRSRADRRRIAAHGPALAQESDPVRGRRRGARARGARLGDRQHRRNTQLEVDWRPRKDIALIAQAAHARRAARERARRSCAAATGRSRTSCSTITHRHDTDWRWDPSVPNADPLAAKRYLDLGPVVPQLLASARAGTLIKENIDCLRARGGGEGDLASRRSDAARTRRATSSSVARSSCGCARTIGARRERPDARDDSATRRSARRSPTSRARRSAARRSRAPTSARRASPRPARRCGCPSARAVLGARGGSTAGARGTRWCTAPRSARACRATRRRTLASTRPITAAAAGSRSTRGSVRGCACSRATSCRARSKYQPEISGYKSLRLVMEAMY